MWLWPSFDEQQIVNKSPLGQLKWLKDSLAARESSAQRQGAACFDIQSKLQKEQRLDVDS